MVDALQSDRETVGASGDDAETVYATIVLPPLFDGAV